MIQPALASHFAAEVGRALLEATTRDSSDCDRLSHDLAKIDQAIARVEDAGDQSALLARLEARQAERAALQQRLHDHGAGSARQMLLPSAEELTTRTIDPKRVRWWEVIAHVRWGVIAIQQGRRHASDAEGVNLALTCRIADVLELAALRMTAPGSVP